LRRNLTEAMWLTEPSQCEKFLLSMYSKLRTLVMTSEHAPPPIYSQEYPAHTTVESDRNSDTVHDGEPQLLIVPTVDTINFQKGYLGADGERAAIEGELQIKGTEPERWAKVLVQSLPLH
jgi:hypothetical protein